MTQRAKTESITDILPPICVKNEVMSTEYSVLSCRRVSAGQRGTEYITQRNIIYARHSQAVVRGCVEDSRDGQLAKFTVLI